ncbi:MAG TPA: hypothetical protein VGW35_21700 [Methylomirabilota bacterium]|jgi:hypothetical protein|nr:hypothetical protein [Methylomirabilota bacterium]
MNVPLVLTAIILIAVVYVLLPVAADEFAHFRRPRRLRCPETGADAEVGVDARHAAWTALFRHPVARVSTCSLWPGRRGCAQACVKGADVPAPPASRAVVG